MKAQADARAERKATKACAEVIRELADMEIESQRRAHRNKVAYDKKCDALLQELSHLFQSRREFGPSMETCASLCTHLMAMKLKFGTGSALTSHLNGTSKEYVRRTPSRGA